MLTNFEELQNKIKAFIQEMESQDVKILIQGMDITGRCLSMGNMNVIETLGAIEYAKSICVNGVNSHQAFDSFVQHAEKRPDLMRRLHIAMTRACDCGEGEEE